MEIASPEAVGMSAERLDRITPIMEAFVRDNQMPGILTLIQRRGQIAQLGKYGLMDIEAGKPMQDDALFRIYSMTKPIVSVALMMLYEEGRFSLKDPVSRFIPAFGKTKVYAGMEALGMKLVEQEPAMNLHHLLTHTAGLSYGWNFDSPVEELYREVRPALIARDQTLPGMIECLAELPLLYQPGTQWRYSFATDVVGYVVQLVADKPLDEFLRERILEPLGMMDTAFYVPAEKVGRLAQFYESAGLDDPQPVPPADVYGIGDVAQPTQRFSGGSGLVTTLADYLAFCNCLLNNGAYDGGRLLSRKTLAWMTANHIPQDWLPLNIGASVLDHGFGLGFRVTTDLGQARSLRSVGEYGWSGAAKTYFWVDPAEEFIGLFMTQYRPTDEYPAQERFRNLAYQAIVD
jgi:CubicO group peptidase (beta-lactamase class C family)